jgi:N-acyl homoserine lactone hydrolase
VLVAALLALAAIGLLTRDGFRRWQTSAYVVAPSSYRTWDEVFAHPAPVTVETLVTGFIDMNRCDNLDASNPTLSSCRSPEPLLDLAHLVRHSRLGVRNGQRAHQSAAEILRARGLHPRAVFFTHLHPDHTSGAAELPADVDYVFGSQEAGFLACVAVGSHFEGKSRLRTLDYTDVAPMPPLGPAVDLLGDGSLWAISTPGRTPGHSSYLVNGDPPTLLVGDASHFAWAFEHDVAPRAWRARTARAP